MLRSSLLRKNLLSSIMLTIFALTASPSLSEAQVQVPERLIVSQLQPLAGSWQFLYDVPAFGPPIPALLTFTQGGLLIESDYPGATPFGGAVGVAIASNGHGAWKQLGRERGTYIYKKILYNTDGTQYGIATTVGIVTVDRSFKRLSVKLNIQFTDKTGRVVFNGEGSASADRIED